MPGQHTDHPSSIHARSVQRPPQLHACQVSIQTTPGSSMPGQHTYHPSSIHARSVHRHPHLHPCQVSAQTTPAPSMPLQCTDHPNSINARSAHTLFMMPDLLAPYRDCVLNLFSIGDIPFVHIPSQPICIAHPSSSLLCVLALALRQFSSFSNTEYNPPHLRFFSHPPRSHHHGYLGHEDLFCIVLLFIQATSS